MRSKLVKLIACASVIITAGLLSGGMNRDMFPITATTSGLAAAALNGGSTTDTIEMKGMSLFTQATLMAAVTAGTSLVMTVTCESSVNGSDFFDVMACSSAGSGVYNCYTWTPTYDLTANTSIVINLPSNYPYIRCTFTDPVAGTGTVTVTGFRGEV
jgi:hypothetical protein